LFKIQEREGKILKAAQSLAITPSQGKNHKAPKPAGERHGKF
jgi:hypothetical protein